MVSTPNGIRKATDGQVNMKMYYGGVAGDEITVVRKMRVGQLDGALITSTGLSALVRQVLVMEAPGLIRSYPELDAVREVLAPDLEALFDKAGYKLLAWGDAGKTRIFSAHRIVGPSDLQKVRPWVWRDSATMRAFIKATGANGVLLNLPEVYSSLQTGIIDTIIAECSASDELVTVTIAVVDRMGLPVMQMRADTASPHNWELAFRKAYTARTFRRTSISLRDRYLSEPTITGQRVLSNIVALGGGVPIMMGDVPIGAVGVSGAVGGQESDTACAQMGIDAIADQLE